MNRIHKSTEGVPLEDLRELARNLAKKKFDDSYDIPEAMKVLFNGYQRLPSYDDVLKGLALDDLKIPVNKKSEVLIHVRPDVPVLEGNGFLNLSNLLHSALEESYRQLVDNMGVDSIDAFLSSISFTDLENDFYRHAISKLRKIGEIVTFPCSDAKGSYFNAVARLHAEKPTELASIGVMTHDRQSLETDTYLRIIKVLLCNDITVNSTAFVGRYEGRERTIKSVVSSNSISPTSHVTYHLTLEFHNIAPKGELYTTLTYSTETREVSTPPLFKIPEVPALSQRKFGVQALATATRSYAAMQSVAVHDSPSKTDEIPAVIRDFAPYRIAHNLGE